MYMEFNSDFGNDMIVAEGERRIYAQENQAG